MTTATSNFTSAAAGTVSAPKFSLLRELINAMPIVILVKAAHEMLKR